MPKPSERNLRMVTVEKLSSTLSVLRTSGVVVQLDEQKVVQRCDNRRNQDESEKDPFARVANEMARASAEKFVRKHFGDGPGIPYKVDAAIMFSGHECLTRAPDFVEENDEGWLLKPEEDRRPPFPGAPTLPQVE